MSGRYIWGSFSVFSGRFIGFGCATVVRKLPENPRCFSKGNVLGWNLYHTVVFLD